MSISPATPLAAQTLRRFRDLLADASQTQDRFLQELEALGARLRNLEALAPATQIGGFAPQDETTPFDQKDCATHFESLEGIIRGWSRAAAHLYGYAPEEVLGKPATILGPERNHRLGLAPVASPVLARLHRSGPAFLVQAQHTAVEDDEGLTLGYLVEEFGILAHQRAGGKA